MDLAMEEQDYEVSHTVFDVHPWAFLKSVVPDLDLHGENCPDPGARAYAICYFHFKKAVKKACKLLRTATNKAQLLKDLTNVHNIGEPDMQAIALELLHQQWNERGEDRMVKVPEGVLGRHLDFGGDGPWRPYCR